MMVGNVETKFILSINRQQRPDYTSLNLLIEREGGLEHQDATIARRAANCIAAHPDVISCSINRVTTELVAVYGHGMYK